MRTRTCPGLKTVVVTKSLESGHWLTSQFGQERTVVNDCLTEPPYSITGRLSSVRQLLGWGLDSGPMT
jgi:hypothetical protein